jgi:hypothetical protein
VICERIVLSCRSVLEARPARPLLYTSPDFPVPWSLVLIYQDSDLEFISVLPIFSTVSHHAVLYSRPPVIPGGARLCPGIQYRRLYQQRPTSRISEVANMCCAYREREFCSLRPADTHMRPIALCMPSPCPQNALPVTRLVFVPTRHML